MAVSVSLRCRMFFYTHTGEVITFLKLQFPHLCIYNVNWRSEIYESVAQCTVSDGAVSNCVEKRGVVDKGFNISLRSARPASFMFLAIEQDVVFY